MQTFDFYRDQKCSVWQRTRFEVKAETYEEALAKVFEMEENDDYEIDTDYEMLYETTTDLTPDMNDNFSTTESYSADKHELIFENGQSIKLKTL